ncbi:MAG: beta-ketoacyl-ACP synthase [bacterium]|nr:beta-ketoacyl-ACP synthase [bacterium]
MSASRCRVADLGLVTSLGATLALNEQRLVAGDTSHLSTRDDLITGESRIFGAVNDALPEIDGALAPFSCRNNQLALAAYESVRNSASVAIAEYGAQRVGVVMGSSTAGTAEAEEAFRSRRASGELPGAFELVQLEYGGLADFIARVSGAAGPSYSISTACSTGAKALCAARRLLELDICDAVITGAADSLCRLTANGFHALKAVSAGITNPMSINRDGMMLGEAAAIFVLTRESGGIQLLGTGESSDAHHMSAPCPDGEGAYRAMAACLADSGLQAGEIAYINLHGTGTEQNDAMESKAVHRLFGSRTPCSSTKPLVGHTLGASGAVEAAFCWLVLTRRSDRELALPPHVYDGDRDTSLAPLALTTGGQRASSNGRVAVMSNSFGFGGSNCSLILGQDDR